MACRAISLPTSTQENVEQDYRQQESGLELEEEEQFFLTIDILQNHGIPDTDIAKLKKIGINTIKGVQMFTKRKLKATTDLSEQKIDMIKDAAKILDFTGFQTALQFTGTRKKVFHIITGSQQLDYILGGGIESMGITEAFGEFRTGKTQISHTLCVSCQLPGPNGYRGGKAIYIDTENCFRPDRIRDIADRFQMNQTSVLDNILYARALNSDHQFELLDLVAGLCLQEAGAFKLLVVDSIIALFRVDYPGRNELQERQQKLGQYLSRLQKLSEEFNLAIFITNHVTEDLSVSMSFSSAQKIPIGGNVLAHAATTRILLKKGINDRRIAKIYDSPQLPQSQATFQIVKGGIIDPIHINA